MGQHSGIVVIEKNSRLRVYVFNFWTDFTPNLTWLTLKRIQRLIVGRKKYFTQALIYLYYLCLNPYCCVNFITEKYFGKKCIKSVCSFVEV